jgi:uncharacterized C2H2 Zn-finger protein
VTLPQRFCLDCKKLFDRDLTGTMRCPRCQVVADRQRDAQRGSTAQRGYGSAHQRKRAELVAAFVPGQPCARCGRPIARAEDADLGHTDDRSGYRGLEHAAECNRAAGGKSRRGSRQPASAPGLYLDDEDGDADGAGGQDDGDWIGIA